MFIGDKSKYLNTGLDEPDIRKYNCGRHTWEALGTYEIGIWIPDKYQDICPECGLEGDLI